MTKKSIFQKKISIIKEVANTITSTDNSESIANLILDLALSNTKAKSGSIMLLDTHGNLTIRAAKNMDSGTIPHLNLKTGVNICDHIAKAKTTLMPKDIKRDKRFRKKGNGKCETKYGICCPITKKDKLLGVINLSDKVDGSAFTEDDADLIDILANQTAIALDNARLMSELRSKASELDEMNRKLIDSNRHNSEFIANMSHELRTPLNAINGATYYLREKKDEKTKPEEFVEIISDETSKLINLLERLLNFTNLEKEELILNRKVINLIDVMQEAIGSRIVKNVLSNNKITLQTSYPESLSDIVGEKIYLIQSIIHLIEGIISYAVSGDSIEIKATDKKTAIELKLLVKGRTIPDSELPFILDEHSLWSGTENIKNKLKFYLAKKTIELHKGSISASNTAKGLCVLINFQKDIKAYHDAETDELMGLFLLFISESMNLHKCSIMLSDNKTGELRIRSSLGIDENTIRNTRVKIGDKIAGWVAAKKTPLLIENIEKDSQIGRKNGPQYNTKSLLCLPIVVNEKVVGVLNLNNKANAETFDKKDLYIAMAITDRISLLIDKVQRGGLRNSDFKTAVKSMEALLNAGKQYKKKNGRFLDLVFKTMQSLKRSDDEIKLALYTSELYDLGLTQIDESILMKNGELSSIEQKIIRTHPFPGVGLIEHIETDDSVKKIILHHHERYDGNGYPARLKGDNIPFTSRVLTVVDTFTAMTADRPYRKALSIKETIKQIKAGSGMQFDPRIVEAFTKVV